jgi:fructose-1,6-bisphosphatase/sedoheptulose 1,7-bisphosphatase-like protein
LRGVPLKLKRTRSVGVRVCRGDHFGAIQAGSGSRGLGLKLGAANRCSGSGESGAIKLRGRQVNKRPKTKSAQNRLQPQKKQKRKERSLKSKTSIFCADKILNCKQVVSESPE